MLRVCGRVAVLAASTVTGSLLLTACGGGGAGVGDKSGEADHMCTHDAKGDGTARWPADPLAR